ncbi:MAG: hypothetical protein R3C11_14635 [Planctomycetaceae bacterium]
MKFLKIDQTPEGIRITDFSLVTLIITTLLLGMFLYLAVQLDENWLLPKEITDDVKAPFDASPRVATCFLLGIFGLFGLLMSTLSTYTTVLFSTLEDRVYWTRLWLFGFSRKSFQREEVTDIYIESSKRFELKNWEDDFRFQVILQVGEKNYPLSFSRHMVTPEQLRDYKAQMEEVRLGLQFTDRETLDRNSPEKSEFL